MLSDGYKSFPVVDASEKEIITKRDHTPDGAGPAMTFALGRELQPDWNPPTANDMLKPFTQSLSEYGFVLHNTWNPFGMVK